MSLMRKVIKKPPIYYSINSWWYKINNYYKIIPSDNTCIIMYVLSWLFLYSHQIKGKGCVIWTYNYKNKCSYTYQLHPFNTAYPIKTEYGTIYVKIISIYNKINAIELSVKEP